MASITANLTLNTPCGILKREACQFASLSLRKQWVRKQVGKQQIRQIKASAKQPITFHIGETSISIPLTTETAKEVDNAFSELLTTFREKEKATRPQRWKSMEFRHSGKPEEGDVFFELFCNPNAWSNAFQAKVLITVKDDKIKFTSEGPLSAIKADVDQFLQSN